MLDDGRGGDLVGLALFLGQVLAAQAVLDQPFLQAAERLELAGDGVEGGHDALAQLGFHRADGRPGAVVEIVVVVDDARRRLVVLLLVLVLG